MNQKQEAAKGIALGGRLHDITPWVIVLCALTLGLESQFHEHLEWAGWFKVIDILLLGYFTVEISIRIWLAPKFGTIRQAFRSVMFTTDRGESVRETVEETCWLAFDTLITLLGLLSLLRHYVDHPELIMAFRLFRVFRVLRLFEISPTLKDMERKIISVVPTVLVFAVLQALILYTYAIIGMNLYGYKDFATLHFSSLYDAITSLFMVMTNGWSGALLELKVGAPEISPFVTDLYLFSFFIFSVMITLNVFISVMANQVEGRMNDKLGDEMDKIEKQEQQTEMLLRELRDEIRSLREEIRQNEKPGPD